MRRTARLTTLIRRTDPRRRARHPTDGPPQDNAHLRASDPAAPAHPALGSRELNSPRISYASRRPRNVNRCERRRTEQTDDERDWEKARAGEIHDCSGL
jgi:hypothetical protein